MNTQSSSTKNLLIGVAIVAVAAIAYFYYKGTRAPANSASLLAQQPDTTAVGSQVLSLLNQINSLKLDTSIFNDPAYRTLRDYTVQIPQVNVGRSNPFAPLPGMTTAAAGSAAVSGKSTGR